MIASTRFASLRLFTSLVVLAAISVYPAAIHAQASAGRLLLPDAPEPQGQFLAAAEIAEPSLISSSEREVSPFLEFGLQSQTSAAPQTDDQKKRVAEEESKRELHQRMGGVVPNFNAVLDGVTVPLTPKQKMRAAFRSSIDPYQFGLAIVTSGIGQAEDSHHDYGQGAQGYGKRLGANFTDQFDGTIIGNGILPALLKQDARYFRLGTGSFEKRLLYAVGTTVRCKGDNGKWQPNYSNVLGNIAAGGISNLYYPSNERGFGLTIEQGLEVTAEGSIGALLIEFFPDIKKHYSKKSTQ